MGSPDRKERSPHHFKYKLSDIIDPYLPPEESLRYTDMKHHATDALLDAMRHAQYPWSILKRQEQVYLLAASLSHERPVKASILLHENPEPIKPWGESERRHFLWLTLSIQIRQHQKRLDILTSNELFDGDFRFNREKEELMEVVASLQKSQQDLAEKVDTRAKPS